MIEPKRVLRALAEHWALLEPLCEHFDQGTLSLGELRAQHASLSDVYAAAAAAQVLQQRRRAGEILTALGVDVVDADADHLPPALADHYLALKARGLL